MSYSEILVYFYSARRVGFYFDLIQIAIGEQGHVEVQYIINTKITLSVTVPGGNSPPVICGLNTGQHMYIDPSDQCNDLAFNIGNYDND